MIDKNKLCDINVRVDRWIEHNACLVPTRYGTGPAYATASLAKGDTDTFVHLDRRRVRGPRRPRRRRPRWDQVTARLFVADRSSATTTTTQVVPACLPAAGIRTYASEVAVAAFMACTASCLPACPPARPPDGSGGLPHVPVSTRSRPGLLWRTSAVQRARSRWPVPAGKQLHVGAICMRAAPSSPLSELRPPI